MRKMHKEQRFLLISFNHEISPYPVMPLGAFYIKDYLEKNNISVDIIDLYIEEDYKSLIKTLLSDDNYIASGISIRNIDNILFPSTISWIDEIKEIVDYLRTVSDIPVILGGSGYSIFPRAMLQYCRADYGIKGEGEQILLTTLNNLDNAEFLSRIPNLYILDSKDNTAGIPRELLETGATFSDSWPSRDPALTVPYIKTGGMISLQIKRGCPFNCIYCTYPDIDGRNIRIRKTQSLLEEISHLKSSFDFDYFYFVDSIFNYPLQETKDFLLCLKKSGLKIKWTGFFNPKFIDREFLELTRDTGCDEIEFGIESGSEIILKDLEKGFSRKDIRKAKQISDELGIRTMFYLLIGSPAETFQTIDESIAFIEELSPDAVAVMLGIRVYPNTRLYSHCISENQLSPDDPLLKPYFYIKDDIMEYASKRFEFLGKNDPRWVVPSLGINYYPEKLIKLRKFGSKGPLWSRLKNTKSHKN